MKNDQITAILHPPGNPFGTDFYIRATIEIESYGSPETGRGYMADPAGYDPGSGPEWTVAGTPELFHDCGGDGEKLTIGESLADSLKDLIAEDKALIEQVEEAIAKVAAEDREA